VFGEVTLWGRCLAVAVSTRDQNCDDAAYEAHVTQPHDRTKALQDDLEARAAL
jgi:hypothetical protein